jgi:tRNA nucleotidyltransferase/poly(A) polymerase
MVGLVIDQLQGLLLQGPAESHFVGGCVRDLLMGRPLHDLDLVVAGDAIAVARTVARAFHAAFVLLDEQNGIARVVLRGPDGEAASTIDFARMRGDTLAEDLAARDLTINAIAMAPDAFRRFVRREVDSPEVIDPHGGQADLAAGRLRAVSLDSFTADPLRTMRVVRFAGELHFAIVPETAEWVRQTAGLLPRVSWERIRDELVRLLACPQAAPHLPLLASLDLLPYVLPELAARPAPWQDQAWEMVAGLEWFAAHLEHRPLPEQSEPLWRPAALSRHPDLPLDLPHATQLRRYLEEGLAERPRLALLKLAALLRAEGEEEAGPGAQEAARRLRLSTREALSLDRSVRFVEWTETAEATRRYVYRLHRDAGEDAVGVLLLGLAHYLAQAGPDPDVQQWQERVALVRWTLNLRFERPDEVIDPPRLLDGSVLIRVLGLKPGPLVGDLLEGIREAQAAGEIHSREEALSWARRALGE